MICVYKSCDFRLGTLSIDQSLYTDVSRRLDSFNKAIHMFLITEIGFEGKQGAPSKTPILSARYIKMQRVSVRYIVSKLNFAAVTKNIF